MQIVNLKIIREREKLHPVFVQGMGTNWPKMCFFFIPAPSTALIKPPMPLVIGNLKEVFFLNSYYIARLDRYLHLNRTLVE